MSRRLICHKVSLGNFLSRKRTYMLIDKFCLSVQWLMLLYSYMIRLVVITTMVSMDAEKKTVIEKVIRSSKQRILLHECGCMLPVPANVLNNLERKNSVT